MRKMLDMIVSDALILPIPQLLLKNHPDFECWLTVDALDALSYQLTNQLSAILQMCHWGFMCLFLCCLVEYVTVDY